MLTHEFLGLSGRNDWEQARVDEAVLTYRDLHDKTHEYMALMAGLVKEGNKVEILKKKI